MKIAIITPYFKESLDVLEQNYKSVIDQDLNTDHYFIADGYPLDAISKWKVKHIILDKSHDDNGNTPRGVGSKKVRELNYDFLAYLDADNWFHKNHLKSLINLYNDAKVNICCSKRTFHHMNGKELYISEMPEDEFEHVDTSCFLIHNSAFELTKIWEKMPKILSPICDRIFYKSIFIHKKYSIAFSNLRTVAFRSQYLSHYKSANEQPPKNLKGLVGRESYEWLKTEIGKKISKETLGFWPYDN
jgi:glycosyltransferase involved in cell wall biosynthesis